MILLYLTTFTYKLLLTKVIHKDVIHKAFIFFLHSIAEFTNELFCIHTVVIAHFGMKTGH